jgi:hypothetical protein
MSALARLAMLSAPVAVIRAYRLIPCRIRAAWSMGTSSSGRALALAQETGNGWAAIARYASPVRAFENQSWDN